MSKFLKIPMFETEESNIVDIGRPCIHIICNGTGLDCMIDTGSNISVFVSGKRAFDDIFPDAELDNRFGNLKISGFGGSGTQVDVYKVKSLQIALHGTDDFIVIRNVPIAVCLRECLGANIILSSGLFNKMSLVVNTLNRNDCYVGIEHEDVVYNSDVSRDINGNINRVYSYVQLEGLND